MTLELGNWIQTHTHRAFSLTTPDAADVTIEDIAHSLSQICRFNGHTRVPYSVAEHSVRCSQLVDQDFALDALLHDAGEAYFGDVSTPLKRELGAAWADVEERIGSLIADKFGVLWPPPRAVVNADLALLEIECRDLLGAAIDDWSKMGAMAVFKIDVDELVIIEPWTPDFARHRFLERYHTLMAKHCWRVV